MSEYIQTFIKKEYLSELKNDKQELLFIIQLSRIVNSLRSNLRSYIAVDETDIIKMTKDRLDIILIHGSLLYEAIGAISIHGRRIKCCKIWNEISEEYKYFNKQNGDKKSFRNTILNKIRNKLFFHFDLSELLNTLQHFNFDNDMKFIISKTESIGDLIYSFADDLVLTYITQLDDTSSHDIKELVTIQTTIIDMSHRICSLCENILKELLEDKSYKTKSKI